MTSLVGAAFCGAAVAMVADWIAVDRGAERMEAMAKPLVMVMLIAAVAGMDDLAGSVRFPLLAALTLAAIGDVLLLPGLDRFVPGLLAFLGTHVAYLAAFVAAGISPPLVVVGALVATTAGVGVGRPIVAGAAGRDVRLGRAVVVYVVVLSAMAAAAIAVAHALAVVGAILFVTSDAVLGWNRFVESIPRGRLLTHVPYHLGQALIAAWAWAL